LTAIPAQIKHQGSPRQYAFGFVGPLRIHMPGCCKAFGSSMHFGFYLVVAALVILGAEVAYALYQLVNLTL